MRLTVIALAGALVLTGCTKEMGDQPKIESFEGHPAPPPAGAISQEQVELEATDWPAKPTLAQMHRGQERYNIYCSTCHGLTGAGDGMVVKRGFPKPVSFFEPSQRAQTKEHIYDVIDQGYGRMSQMADKLTPTDRRLVALYVKALQLSRSFPKEKLNDTDRARLKP